MKRDSDLFKPLVATAEKYLKDYCDGKQESDEKAKVALRVLSLYRRILRHEREHKAIRLEWEKLITGVNALRKAAKNWVKQKQKKGARKVKPKSKSKKR